MVLFSIIFIICIAPLVVLSCLLIYVAGLYVLKDLEIHREYRKNSKELGKLMKDYKSNKPKINELMWRQYELLVEMEADFDRKEYLNYLEKYGR